MIEIKIETEIDQSAEKCWGIFGGQYANIQNWMSGVSKSEPEGTSFQDSPISSRKIYSKGISFSEKLTLFSDEQRAFNYEVIGLPFVVKSAKNDWKFTETNGKTTLHMHLRIELASGFGWLLSGVIRSNISKAMYLLHKDFKHFAETGKVHPRKEKELGN